MSRGYMPKKVKARKHHQRMRKRYDKFSCSTCKKSMNCRKRIKPTPPLGALLGYYEDCPEWKLDKKKKVKNEPKEDKKKPSIFQRIIRNKF